MLRITSAVLFALSLLGSSASFAQSTPVPTATTPASDPQAIAVVRSTLAALSAAFAVADATLIGKATTIVGPDNESGAATLSANSLGDSRIDLSLPSGTSSEIRNHAAAPLATRSSPGVAFATVPNTPRPVSEWIDPERSISRRAPSQLGYGCRVVLSGYHRGQSVVSAEVRA